MSLAIGLYETFGQPTKYDEKGQAEPKVEWVEGVAIIVAVAIVSVVGAANDWQKERQFVKLNRKKEDHHVTVIRDGTKQNISVFDVMVGDLVSIEPGDILSADGVLVNGFGIQTDESRSRANRIMCARQPLLKCSAASPATRPCLLLPRASTHS